MRVLSFDPFTLLSQPVEIIQKFRQLLNAEQAMRNEVIDHVYWERQVYGTVSVNLVEVNAVMSICMWLFWTCRQ